MKTSGGRIVQRDKTSPEYQPMGISELANLKDTEFTDLQDGDVLVYSNDLGMWVNGIASGDTGIVITLGGPF